MLTVNTLNEVWDLVICHMSYSAVIKLKRTSKYFNGSITDEHVLQALMQFGRIKPHPHVIRMVDFNDRPAEIRLLHPDSTVFTFRYAGIEYFGIASRRPAEFHAPDFEANPEKTLR